MSTFDDLLTFIETETTFASSYYDESYLDRRISARMRRTKRDSYDEYLALLREDPAEREELLDTLSVNVTSFFRDGKVWTAMRDVLKDLAASNRTVRIWSAACADGREPYSLSMLALDAGLKSRQVDILATDIDENALERARQGVYTSSRTTDLDEQLSFLDAPSSYVEKDGDQIVISETVKDLVTFDRHDLITGNSKDGFDMVLCRNVCIYLDTEYKRPILETVSESLGNGGVLVLGQTETLPPDIKDRFEAEDPRLRIYRRRRSD
ncbi:CheR family methyltransferase [Halanaeroarchaeum sulfurireducens]|uniref:protein-glutamate O-methyltransferase n=1 Tax=Halanaeroarchaeum sulfurireducens TaxID=1604004 RepID=A0A0F7PCC8_9EURY|nr:protein-glutamate O-methyltransferase CheR [Halanaeroarchaeum sulfurireducens]AKH97845.1 chemotaxis protein CheR [Halanaeroarchaeum sulfurireducens]ALG82239.1 chemotaxis protein CheR [Halanaeroarchaeum sulfurireducens]